MSCCGKKRTEWLHSSNHANGFAKENEESKPPVYFEYTGETGLTAVGSVTHIRYRFNAKGDRQAVDPGDASGMMAVPMLKRVRVEQ